MSENKKKILEMLAENKITADEALRLLAVLDSPGNSQSQPRQEQESKSRGKYLRVTVTPGEEGPAGKGNLFQDGNVGRVNVRVPMSLIRAGIKLSSLIPSDALDKINNSLREKGIEFDVRHIKRDEVEEIIEALGDMQVDVEGGSGEKVRVFVE